MNHSFDIEHARLYGIPEAILIGNFQFWIAQNRANGTNQHDGRTWTYNSVKAFAIQFPYMTGDKIRRALESLEKQGVVVTGFHSKDKADRKKWYAFADEAVFLPALPHLAKNPNAGKDGASTHLAKTPNGLAKTPSPFGENAKSTNTTDVNPHVTSHISPDEQTSEELFELAWSAYPKRPGASKKDSLKQWNARLKAGANPLEIIEGVKAYAVYVAAKGTEPEFVKQPATFFGPGEHFRADWTPPQRAALPAAASAQARFNPNEFVSSGAAYARPTPAYPAADPYTIDAQFVDRSA